MAPQPGRPGEAVGAVADEREVVRDRGRGDAEALLDGGGVASLALAAVELDDLAADALRQVLVRRRDHDAAHRGVLGGPHGGGRERVVSLEVDHRPDAHAERLQPVLKRRELPGEGRVDALAGLVAPARDRCGTTRPRGPSRRRGG